MSFSIFLFGQEEKQKVYDINQIQGIWQMYANYSNPNEDAYYKNFYFIKGRKCLNVDIRISPYDKLNVVVFDYGFSNTMLRDSINKMDHLNDAGKYLVLIEEKSNLKDCSVNIVSPFGFKENTYLNLFGDECIFIKKIPRKVIEILYNRGRKDHRDYNKEFLDLKVCVINIEKSLVYDSTQCQSKLYLIKDDLVTITEEKGRFIKFEYENDKGIITEGWIKKEDLDCIVSK